MKLACWCFLSLHESHYVVNTLWVNQRTCFVFQAVYIQKHFDELHPDRSFQCLNLLCVWFRCLWCLFHTWCLVSSCFVIFNFAFMFLGIWLCKFLRRGWNYVLQRGCVFASATYLACKQPRAAETSSLLEGFFKAARTQATHSRKCSLWQCVLPELCPSLPCEGQGRHRSLLPRLRSRFRSDPPLPG